MSALQGMTKEALAQLYEPQPNSNSLEPAATLTCAASIKPEPVRWVWEGWLAAGKMHVLAGAPGTGKTTIALALTATLTSGGSWPNGTSAETGDVLIWSSEDDPKDTLVPRLIAMGADIRRVHFVTGASELDGKKRPFDPANDMLQLQTVIERMDLKPKLLIVDPIVSAVAGDSHKNGETRRGLQPLVDLGMTLDCAVLGISHFSKGTAGRDVVERVTGSLAFGALARIVLAAVKMPEERGGDRLLARAKSNIGPDTGGYRYELRQMELTHYPEISASCVLWGEAVEGSAREMLAHAEVVEDKDRCSQRDDAGVWLRDLLSNGRMTAKDVKRKASESGHQWRTVQRAKEQAGVTAHREGFGREAVYYWSLTSCAPEPPMYANSQNVARMDECGTHDETEGDRQ